MKFFHQPPPITVTENYDGEPSSFFCGKEMEKISRIVRRWRISKNWWRKEISREYFRVETRRGSICEIYCDLLTQSWYLQRICD